MANQSTPLIEFSNVSKKYKNITALQEASFSINKGDIFGYIGPNGAGKTTTLKILVGLLREYTGDVKINGELVNNYENISELIGYLPQDVGFQEWRSVNHILTTFGLLSGMTREELAERIPEVLQLVGLIDARYRKIKHLSGGMKQKLKLVQALLHNPPILILDEPMSGLDPTSRWQMKNIIKKLAQTEVTIIFSSHILEDVEGIATRIGIINRGKIVKIGKPSELQKELAGGEGVIVIGKKIIQYKEEINNLSCVAIVRFDPNNPDRGTIVFQPKVDLEEALIQLLNFFASNRIAIKNFNYLKPSLEEVYLKYIEEDDAT
ncbi:MAG: ATP-binding cassette domain-containing protein [Candidatus Heimdallarchaeota archaeon]|nr:ATP-binding cassette domain-containing protein [Candidatus Heimdallarchaeota archaeon]